METTQTSRKYNLKNDIIFKTFFSRKGNEIFLIDFLNALLKIDIEKITIREEVNLEQLSTEEKGGRLDLQAELNSGIIVNIELQIRNELNIEERTTAYSAKVMARNIERGTKYEDIKRVIMINILDYEIFDFNEYVSESVTVLDKHREHELLNDIKYYFVELPKFRKQHPDMNNKLNQWLAFIDDTDRRLIKMAEKKNKVLEKARVEINYLTGDAEVKWLEELREKWEMDRISAISYAEKRGKKIGEDIGRKKEKEEIAKKLLEQNVDMETIISATGLTEQEIESLK